MMAFPGAVYKTGTQLFSCRSKLNLVDLVNGNSSVNITNLFFFKLFLKALSSKLPSLLRR